MPRKLVCVIEVCNDCPFYAGIETDHGFPYPIICRKKQKRIAQATSPNITGISYEIPDDCPLPFASLPESVAHRLQGKKPRATWAAVVPIDVHKGDVFFCSPECMYGAENLCSLYGVERIFHGSIAMRCQPCLDNTLVVWNEERE